MITGVQKLMVCEGREEIKSSVKDWCSFSWLEMVGRLNYAVVMD